MNSIRLSNCIGHDVELSFTSSPGKVTRVKVTGVDARYNLLKGILLGSALEGYNIEVDIDHIVFFAYKAKDASINIGGLK